MGADLSVSSCGIVICRNGLPIATRLIRTTTKTGSIEERIRLICKAVGYGNRKYRPDLIVLEGHAGHGNFRASTTLHELHGAVKQVLWKDQSPFVIVPPLTLKAFAGHGHATKDEMIAWAKEIWPSCPDQDDIADAFWLAYYGYVKYDDIVSPA